MSTKAVTTSEIEGEILDRASVQSSIRSDGQSRGAADRVRDEFPGGSTFVVRPARL
jgi:hypothetical protein